MRAVEYEEAREEIEAFARAKESVYGGNDFVVQCRYALWMLAKDAEGQCGILSDLGNRKNLGMVAAALADLDAKAARDAIAARAATITNEVAKEAVAEALLRLEHQQGAPAVAGG